MMSQWAMGLVALATMATASERQVDSFSHRQVPLGQAFQIQTADRTFRGKLVDRNTGECQLAMSLDNGDFSPARTVFLLGATAGPQDRQTLVMMHEVRVGLKMELGLGDLEARHRLVTGEVTGIKLLP